jgi:hypothetical protein
MALLPAGIAEEKAVHLGNTECRLVVTAAGKEYSLEVLGKKDESSYYCRSSELPYAVFLGSWRAEKLMKSIDDLKK